MTPSFRFFAVAIGVAGKVVFARYSAATIQSTKCIVFKNTYKILNPRIKMVHH
jgi:hypothetical protein